ncbi:MAG TPA: 1-acyl-sn-glycerol-3-phosphate acyltransferase [Telluria sp.]|nr:1-acyl-sn-glycerol-3-phosphate acyltransferase [Telluria sp.]
MSDHLLRPAALPTWGQRTSLRLLNLIGWNVRFKPLPGPHGIAVVYPHTSNWDFPIGLLAKWAVGLPFRWLAKDSLFKGPMGALMRYWGGIAVDRTAPQGATTRLAQQMLQSEWCWVAITPEGTRSYRPHWKSGFYRLAMAAKVPLVVVYIDYKAKELGVVDIVNLTGDEDADMAVIARVYEGREALYPSKAAPIMLAPREDKPGSRQQA